MPSDYTIEVRGLNRLLRALQDTDPLFAEPLRNAFDEGGDLMLEAAQTRAPSGRGTLAQRITKRLDSRPVPRFVKVGPTPMPLSTGGFRYPGALEGGEMYHYRSGPFAGQKTRGWLSGVKKDVARYVRQIIKAAGKEIEAAWIDAATKGAD